MRTTPLVGEKVWFAPRRLGWGLSPISVEGWIATVGSVGLGFVVTRRWPERKGLRRLPGIGLLAIALVKGTAPGGRRAREEFEQGGQL
jgi:hypothetical protein